MAAGNSHYFVNAVILAFLSALMGFAPCSIAQESESSLPDLLGDNFDGMGRSLQFTIPFDVSFFANGVLLPAPGSPSANGTILALEADSMGFPDDLFGLPAIDANGNIIPKTFTIVGEPIPPSEIPTTPGQGFVFDGGIAIYTGSVDLTTPSSDPLPPLGEDGIYSVNYSFSQTIQRVVSSGGGLAVRRIKIAENNRPIPTDRVFFNYNFFNDVPNGLNDVSRYTLGVEHTFWNRNASFELRVPFAATLDSEQDLDGLGARNFEFGNATIIWKYLLRRSRSTAWTVGTGITLPIAQAAEYSFGGTTILRIDNDSPHFLPFMAAAWTPNPRTFGQAFVQVDVDAYGNRVAGSIPDFANFPPPGRRLLPQIGIVNDASLMFIDVGFGRWLYTDPASSCVTGFAVVAEYHYSTTLNDADIISADNIYLTDVSRRTDILNLTLGTHLSLRNGLEISNGFVLPARKGGDRPFDFEYALQVDRRF